MTANWIFTVLGFGTQQFVWALAVTIVFSVVARWLRGVSSSGAIAGAFVCFVLYVSAGPGAFLVLVSVFLVTWLATRFGYKRKQKLGTAENRAGRTASQVLANLAAAAGCVAISAFLRENIFLIAGIAALAEAAADTVSSEMGQVSVETVRLVTNWRAVPAGTNGGVSPLGTLSGVVAAAIVSAIAFLAGLVSLRGAYVSLFGGVAGMIADSYLGATLERRGMLGNDGVNFISTLIAAGVALVLA